MVLVVFAQGQRFYFNLETHTFETNTELNRLTVFKFQGSQRVAGVEVPANKVRVAQFAGNYAFNVQETAEQPAKRKNEVELFAGEANSAPY